MPQGRFRGRRSGCGDLGLRPLAAEARSRCRAPISPSMDVGRAASLRPRGPRSAPQPADAVPRDARLAKADDLVATRLLATDFADATEASGGLIGAPVRCPLSFRLVIVRRIAPRKAARTVR